MVDINLKNLSKERKKKYRKHKSAFEFPFLVLIQTQNNPRYYSHIIYQRNSICNNTKRTRKITPRTFFFKGFKSY